MPDESWDGRHPPKINVPSQAAASRYFTSELYTTAGSISKENAVNKIGGIVVLVVASLDGVCEGSVLPLIRAEH